MDMQFKRILNLVRRTGDRMVVTDPNGEDTYVIMGFDAYEALMEAQEYVDDLETGAFDPMEPSLPAHAHATESPAASEEINIDEAVAHDLRVWEAMKAANEPGETWDVAKLSLDEKQQVQETYQAFQEERQKPEVTQIPEQKPQMPSSSPAAEASSKKSDEDEPGEEQFYLEPVE